MMIALTAKTSPRLYILGRFAKTLAPGQDLSTSLGIEYLPCYLVVTYVSVISNMLTEPNTHSPSGGGRGINL